MSACVLCVVLHSCVSSCCVVQYQLLPLACACHSFATTTTCMGSLVSMQAVKTPAHVLVPFHAFARRSKAHLRLYDSWVGATRVCWKYTCTEFGAMSASMLSAPRTRKSLALNSVFRIYHPNLIIGLRTLRSTLLVQIGEYSHPRCSVRAPRNPCKPVRVSSGILQVVVALASGLRVVPKQSLNGDVPMRVVVTHPGRLAYLRPWFASAGLAIRAKTSV